MLDQELNKNDDGMGIARKTNVSCFRPSKWVSDQKSIILCDEKRQLTFAIWKNGTVIQRTNF